MRRICGKIFPLSYSDLSHRLDSMAAFSTPEEFRIAKERELLTRAQTVDPGDVLRYMDGNNECCIRIKDHGSSDMRGEFFIVTTIIDEDEDEDEGLMGKYDREVTAEEMEKMVQNRIS